MDLTLSAALSPPLHEPAILLRTQFPYLFSRSRPLKPPLLKALAQQHKAIVLPAQRLDPVISFPAEQKQTV